jgi:DNA-binding beta-propeller fold protein YncE
VFDASGKFLREWPQSPGGIAKEAHGLYVDRNGFVWTTDVQGHTVKKFRADGTLVMTLGKPGVPGETADTFNQPTNVWVAANGDIFVTDGYGNQRMVKLNKDGKFIKAWGTKGTGPGQFRLPHAVVQDSRGRVLVADRCGLGATKCTDGRIQIFDADGKFLSEWLPPGGGPFAPFALSIAKDDTLYIGDAQNAKVWIVNAQTGQVQESVEQLPGLHGMDVDANGDIYIASVGGGVRRLARER